MRIEISNIVACTSYRWSSSISTQSSEKKEIFDKHVPSFSMLKRFFGHFTRVKTCELLNYLDDDEVPLLLSTPYPFTWLL